MLMVIVLVEFVSSASYLQNYLFDSSSMMFISSALGILGLFFVTMPLMLGQSAVWLDLKRDPDIGIIDRLFKIGYSNVGKAIVYTVLISLIVIGTMIAWIFVCGLCLKLSGEDIVGLEDTLSVTSTVILVITMLLWAATILYFSYIYSLTPFLVLDNPEMSAVECMRKSRNMMKGHCLKLFLLDLTFIGWWILCIFIIPILVVIPYQQTAHAAFYCDLIEEKDTGKTEEGKIEEEKSILENQQPEASSIIADEPADMSSEDRDVNAEDFQV